MQYTSVVSTLLALCFGLNPDEPKPGTTTLNGTYSLNII